MPATALGRAIEPVPIIVVVTEYILALFGALWTLHNANHTRQIRVGHNVLHHEIERDAGQYTKDNKDSWAHSIAFTRATLWT
jgi:uncharacterized membrane protein